MSAAVFLDRDGVLIQDTNLLVDAQDIVLLPGVPQALNRLAAERFKLIVITNQAVVARGLATEAQVAEINAAIAKLIRDAGGPALDGMYVCPHHPNATLPAYRVDCDCRKPKPGMLLRAARELDVNLAKSFCVGDRITDIIAGARAGCRTVLVETGAHLAPPIETREPLDPNLQPNHTCPDLAAAAQWILQLR